MTPLFRGGGGSEREPGERSAADREHARQEREARRAAREGRSPVVAPSAVEGAVAPAPPQPQMREPPQPVEPTPAPSAPEPELAAIEPAPPAADPEPALPEPEPAAIEPSPVAFEPEPAPPEPEPSPPEPAPSEAPPAPAVPDPHHEPPLWVPAPGMPEDEPAHEPQAPELEQETVAYTVPLDELEPEPHADAPPEHVTEEPAPYDPDAPSVIVHGRTEVPTGVKRVAASAMASAAGAEGPPRFGAPPRGKPRGGRGARRIAALALLVVLAAVAVFLFKLYEPGRGDGSGRVALRVPAGASAAQIGDLLAQKHVVSSSFFFGLRARLSGQRADLRSGDYVLRRDMSYGAALTALTKAPPAAPALAKLTIPEGPSRREVAPLVAKAGLTGSYLKASKRSAALSPRSFGAPKGTTSLEGFLFPATYEFKPHATASSLVLQQLRAFRRTFATVSLSTAKRRKLTRYDVLIIASMIEREAAVPKDRRLIAAVIYNRLKRGMPLQIDATTRYATGNFTRPLTQSQLATNSPYDTRYRVGLPPTPIGNPGLASIKAAADPASAPYLFYVVKPCGHGAHAFSTSSAQFDKDVAAYNAKRNALGGKSPVDC